MIVDLHNHTTLCNHAEGTMTSYIEHAITQGIDIFGFSDHAPMKFDEAYRMRFDQMDQYENDVLHVKELYKDRITVLLAYEVDFLEGLIDERVLRREVDYLIGSVHYLGNWGFDNPEFIGEYQHHDLDTIWQRYFDAIEALAKSGLFDIVGHIDLMKVFNFLPKKDIRLLAQGAIRAIKKANMVVEINASGLRKPAKEQYPSVALLDMLAQADIPITFGSDSHASEHVGLNREYIHALAQRYGYKKCATFEKREREMVIF